MTKLQMAYFIASDEYNLLKDKESDVGYFFKKLFCKLITFKFFE